MIEIIFSRKSKMTFSNALKKLLILLAINSLMLQDYTIAETQICEIRYGEKDLDKEKRANPISRLLNNESQKKCHKIGMEYDNFGQEIPEKPIYACCITNT